MTEVLAVVLATVAAVWALFERRRRAEAEDRHARERAARLQAERERAGVHDAYRRDARRIDAARRKLAEATQAPPELARLFDEVFGRDR